MTSPEAISTDSIISKKSRSFSARAPIIADMRWTGRGTIFPGIFPQRCSQRTTSGTAISIVSSPSPSRTCVDGQPAGQVEQEIYGAGAAFNYASRCFHRPEDVPFTLFCDHFLMSVERRSKRAIEVAPIGVERCPARLRVMKSLRRPLSEPEVLGIDGPAEPIASEKGRWLEYEISASAPTILQW